MSELVGSVEIGFLVAVETDVAAVVSEAVVADVVVLMAVVVDVAVYFAGNVGIDWMHIDKMFDSERRKTGHCTKKIGTSYQAAV